MEKMGQNVHISLRSGPYSQSDRKKIFFEDFPNNITWN